MKFILLFFALFLSLFANAESIKFNPSNAVRRYNSFKYVNELLKMVFAFDKRTTSEDRKLLAQHLNISGTAKLPKATLTAEAIVLGSNPLVKIEFDLAAPGIFKINGTKVKILPKKPLKQTFKEIELAIYSNHSKYEFIFGQTAFAAEPVVTLGTYGVAAFLTAEICEAVGQKSGGTREEILATCREASLKWPKTVWDFIDGIRNGKEILAGRCLAASATNPFGDLVQLTIKDQNTTNIGIYFKTDPKTNLVKLYFFTANSNPILSGQLQEKDEATLHYFVGGNPKAAKEFIEKLEAICKSGGTTELNKLITEKPEIKNGLSKLVKDWNSRTQGGSNVREPTADQKLQRR